VAARQESVACSVTACSSLARGTPVACRSLEATTPPGGRQRRDQGRERPCLSGSERKGIALGISATLPIDARAEDLPAERKGMRRTVRAGRGKFRLYEQIWGNGCRKRR
jgi:hypothetical protein